MAKKKAVKDQDMVSFPTFLRKASAEFIRAAAKKADKPRAQFQREALIAAAAKVLGKEPPKVAEFRRGVTGILQAEAKKQGISVSVLTRKLALAALEK